MQNVTARLYDYPTHSTLYNDSYFIRCPLCGNEYSANPNDYWMGGDTPMMCDCLDADVPTECHLYRKAYVGGETPDGHCFSGMVSVEVKQSVTVDDLRGLKGAN